MSEWQRSSRRVAGPNRFGGTVHLVPRMQVGINYPWAFNKYGTYFGPHMEEPTLPNPAVDPVTKQPLGPLSPISADDAMWMEQWLTEFHRHALWLRNSLKVSVVRIFLMCNALNWGTTTDTGTLVPPPYLHSRYAYHLESLLDFAAHARIKLILSLLDFGIDDPVLGSRRRTAIITNNTVRTSFFTQVLDPMLDASLSHKDSVYAWEVMNEPSWLLAHFWPHTMAPRLPAVTINQLRSFLTQALTRIESRGFPSTVGHRYFSDLSRFPTGRGTIPQFHYYPNPLWGDDPSELPDANALRGSVPMILGEFASRGDEGGQWPELKGRDGNTPSRVYERFACAERKHYELALLWPDLTFEEAKNLNPAEVDPLKLSGDAVQGFLNYIQP